MSNAEHENEVDVADLADEEGVQLPEAEALQPDDSGIVLGREPASLVVFGGAHRSGKTTLIASVYERLVRHGRIADYGYYYSRTLVGFERLCFLGRITSGLGAPEMPRTSKQHGRPMYHLALAAASSKERRSLLLCDVPGEHFDELCDGTADPAELQLVADCDHFVFLLDGAKLARNDTRNGAWDRARLTLRALSESGVLAGNLHIDLLVAKWDVVVSTGADAVEWVKEKVARLDEQTQRAGCNTRVAYVVSRNPHDASNPPAMGIDELFERWLERKTRTTGTLAEGSPVIHREIDRFSACGRRRGAPLG